MYEALNRGDWEGASACLSPEFEWETDPRHPKAGVYRGPDAFRRFLEDLEDPFEQTVTEIEEVFPRGGAGRAVRQDPSSAEAQRGGGADRIGELWTVRDGKLVRGQGFGQREKALEAAGPRDS